MNFDDYDIYEYPKRPKIGDTVLILPKLTEYIITLDWSERMYDIIGKEYKVHSLSKIYETRQDCVVISTKSGRDWFIPFDSVRVVHI